MNIKSDMNKIDTWARIIWDYNCMSQPVTKSDCILALGSHDTRVANRASELFLNGYAPYIIFSGGIGRLTEGKFDRPEADIFADVAISLGVPEDKIIRENKSTNTGENIQFVRKMLENLKLDPKSFIVITKPYMERRAYATFKKNWPEKEITITSPQLTFDEYPTEEITKDEIINIMVGELQRIKIYPQKGFQIYQEIPGNVWQAYEELVELGYDKHLLKD